MFKLIKFVFLALVIHASPAFATPISYVIDIDWTDDGGSGTDLVFDLGSPFGSTPIYLQAAPFENLLRLQFSVFGVTFGATAPADYIDDDALISWDGGADGPAIISLGIFEVFSDSTDQINAFLRFNSTAGLNVVSVFLLRTVDEESVIDNARGVLVGGTFRSVPAPATLALFGLGLAGIGLNRRKRKAH